MLMHVLFVCGIPPKNDIGHIKIFFFSGVDRLYHLHISGLLKGAEDSIPITWLGARTICSAVSVHYDQYEIN